jgi:hypothetical protein
MIELEILIDFNFIIHYRVNTYFLGRIRYS